MSLRWRWIALAGCCLAAGCDDGSSAADRERAEQSAALDDLAATICMQVEACECSEADTASGCLPTETDAWQARLSAGHDRGLSYDGACVEAIATAVGAAGCERPPAGSAHPCHEYCAVFHGERELGQSCHRFDSLVSDCAQGLACSGGRCVDACTLLTGLPAGEVCLDEASGTPLDRCADGLRCDGLTARCVLPPAIGEPCPTGLCADDASCDWQTSTCVALPGEGQSCWESPQCAGELACVYDATNDSATCMPRAQAGEDCSNRACADDLSCAYDNVCRAPAELGQPCDDLGCTSGLVCDFTAGSVCREPPKVGESCPLGVCEPDAWCDTATDPANPRCVAAAPIGEACTGHRQCESVYCPKGYCEARPQLGEDCSGALVCADELSCDGSTCRPSVTAGPAVCVYEGW